MALSNVAISIGNLWQGLIAERFDYATVFYLDAAFVVFALAILPFLKDREEPAETRTVVRATTAVSDLA